jgi:hypothetical protein
MLGAISIYDDTSFWKLGEFKFCKFEIYSIKRLDKATVKSKTKFEWANGCATLGAKGVTKAMSLKWLSTSLRIGKRSKHLFNIGCGFTGVTFTVKLILYFSTLDDTVESGDDTELIKKSKMVCIFSLIVVR